MSRKRRVYSGSEIRFLMNTIPGRSFMETSTLFNEKFKESDPISTEQVHTFSKHRKIGNGRDTRFKKGCHTKTNTPVPIGTVAEHDRGYLYTKISTNGKRRWKRTHIVVWEAANGPVPPGHMVSFRDGDKKNVALENLALITKKEHYERQGERQEKPIGTEQSPEKCGRIKVKAGKNKWISKQAYVWQQANGPIPKGHVVILGDGNNQNITPDNLILVTHAEQAVINRHKLNGKSAGLTKTGILIAGIILKMSARKSRRKKGGRNEALR